MRPISTSILAAAALAIPALAQAQGNCAERDIVVEQLRTSFGEEFAGGGLRNAESIFEVWMSEEKGTWTILMTMADGRSCVMAAGTNWRGAGPLEPKGVAG